MERKEYLKNYRELNKDYILSSQRNRYFTDEEYREYTKNNSMKRYKTIMENDELHKLFKEEKARYMREYRRRKKNN